jgi:glucosamine-6-phosphate deaminase
MILLVTSGDAKADAVAAAFDGPVDPTCPASLLKRHPDVRAGQDPTAASSLSRRGRGLPTVLEHDA